MADIRIKITTDTSELKKEAKSADKVLSRMEKSHEKSVKKRTKEEAKSYKTVDKLQKNQLKSQEKLNKKLEQENKKRLDREVKAEKDAVREKEQARAQMKSFTLQAAGQGLGAVGLSQLGAGVGLIGAGGLLGAGAGIGIAAVAGIANVIRSLVGFQDRLIKFGVQVRLTRGELKGLETEIGILATTTGVKRMDMLEALEGIFATTRTIPALDQLEGIANALRVSGQAPAEFAASIDKIGQTLKTTDFNKIFKTYQLFTVTGDINTAVDALANAFPALKKTEKNMISLANVLQLKPIKSLEDLNLLIQNLSKEGIKLFKDKYGKNMVDAATLFDQINKVKARYNELGREEPEFLKSIDMGRIRLIENAGDALKDIDDKVGELNRSPMTAFERLGSLLELMVSETTMPMLQKGAETFSKWVSDPEKVRKMANAMETLGNAIGSAAKALNWVNNEWQDFKAMGMLLDPKFWTWVSETPKRRAEKGRRGLQEQDIQIAKETGFKYTSMEDWLRKEGINVGAETPGPFAPATTIPIDQKIYVSEKMEVKSEATTKRGEKVDTLITVLPWEQ